MSSNDDLKLFIIFFCINKIVQCTITTTTKGILQQT